MSSGFSCRPIKHSSNLALLLALGVFLALLAAARLSAAAAQDDLAAERARMVTTIAAHAKRASTSFGREFLAPEILKAVGDVPRHEFVLDGLRGDAYADRPLPIGYGQTISQPFIVALMTDLLRVQPDHLVRRVHTIEIVPALVQSAGARLLRLGYDNVATRSGDGYYGWEEAAPFDGIIVTAAASQIPPPLIQQLKPGGRMVIPLGAPFALQHLVLVERNAEGRVTTRQLLPVAFVPLIGGTRQR